MESKRTKTLILNTLMLIFCVVIIALFCMTPNRTKVLEKYTVNFDTGDGNYIATLEIEEGEKASEPEVPKRDGYEFVGWMLNDELYDFSKEVEGDITLKAEWKELDPTYTYYNVTFAANGGTAFPRQVLVEGSLATDPGVPVRDGYNFKGWYYNGEPFDFNTPITQDITLSAEWEEVPVNPEDQTYTVRFNLGGGSGSFPTQTVKAGEKATKPSKNPTRSGYTFEGWKLGSAKGKTYTFNEAVNSNITIYASWKAVPKNTYTVTFIDDTTTVATRNVTEGQITPNIPSRSKQYYTFVGWFNTKQLNGGTNARNLKIVENTKFYARWQKNTFKVTCTLVDQGGGAQSCLLTVNGVATSDIEKVEYHIKGVWRTKAVNSGRYIFNYGSEFTKADEFKITLKGEEFTAHR